MSRSGYGSSNHPDPDLPDVRLPEMEIRILPTLKKQVRPPYFIRQGYCIYIQSNRDWIE